MTDNLALWKAVETTDPKHVKTITGKSYSGNSPKPHYLIHKATEAFGPCGIGWGFSIVDERMEEGAGGERMHIARVRVWYKWNGERGEVEHVGGTSFSGTRASGKPFTDEDAPKKSVTDALVKALSLIGFAGDIFMGRYDDSKYVNDLRREFEPEPEPKRPEPKAVIKDQLVGSLAIVPEVTIPEFVAISQRLLDQISSTVSGFEMDKLVRSPEFKADLAKLPKREQERIAGIGKRHRSTFPVDLTAAG